MLKILKLNTFWLHKATIVVITLVLTINMPIGKASAAWSYNDILTFVNNRPEIRGNLFLVTGGDSLMGVDAPLQQKTIRAVLTAYSSTPDQTDDTPFITASGKHVANGVIAYNKLPFGTKVRIPELYGNKIFTVWDRMHQRMKHFDIWFADTQEAKNFGAKITTIEVVES